MRASDPQPGHRQVHPDRPLPAQRIAVASDVPQIGALMRSSVLELFPLFYDDRQTRSAALHIAHVDESLIDDVLKALGSSAAAS